MAGFTLNHQILICGVTGDGCLVFPAKALFYSLNMILLDGKAFFRIQKDLKLIYL